VKSEESATPDLVELTRRLSRADMDETTTFDDGDIDEDRAAAERLAEERE
jgi:hypothetical protein